MQQRRRSLQLMGLCLLMIVLGMASMMMVAVWKLVVVTLLLPTFFGGYASGLYLRIWSKQKLINRGETLEDAELVSAVTGMAGGAAGTLLLGGLVFLFVVLLRGLGLIG